MPIYTIKQLRDSAPAEFRDLPEDELVRQYSQSTGTSFEQAANYFGIKPRGTLAEMGRQALGGAVVDLPKMVGQGLQYTGIAPEFGREMAESAEARAPEYAPDMRGRGLLGQAGVLGARGLAPVLATAPLAFVPGGQFAAPAAAAALFGTSSAQETYDKLISQGASEQDAIDAARRVGLIQGPLEGVATAVGLRAARPLATALGAAPKTTAGIAGALTETAVAKPFLKGMGVNLVVQPGTEVAQDVGSSLVERAYGAAPEDLGEMAKQSALGGVGLTLLLGPLAGGAAITRARRAQSLKDALYNPDTPVETRAKAMDLVMGEARRQGVAEQDVDTWFNQQLELEDARTAALRAAEQEEKTKQINLLGEQAQELEGLQGGMFSSLDQQRAFEQGLAGVQIDTPFSSLEQQQAFTQGLETARDNNIARVGQQYQDLMGDRASTLMQAQDLGEQAQGILAPQQRGLTAATQAGEQWQEIRAGKTRTMMDIDDMGQEWQKLSKDLPQPVTGELSRAQKAALRGPAGKRLKPTSSPFVPTGQGPASTTLLEPAQGTLPVAVPTPAPAPSSLLSERPVEPVTPPGAADAVAAVLPAATGAAGVSSTVTTGAPSGTQAPQAKQAKAQGQKAPVTAGSVVKVNDTEVTLDEKQAAAWNAAQESYDGKVRRAKALTNYQERDSALRAAGMQLSAERRKITGALTAKEQEAAGPKNVAEAIKEDNEIDRVLKAVEAEDDKTDKLFATVTGDTKKAPGKPSMPTQVYAAIRNAILNPGKAVVVRKAKSVEKDAAATEKYGAKAKRIADAAREFAAAYEAYASQNLVRSGEVIKRDQTADDVVASRATQLKANAAAVQRALAKLGEAVEGNAKDVEAVVRFVKDRAQKEKRGDVKTEKADITLSRAWTAAKSESFMGEPDLLATTGAEVRQSREAAAKGATPQLVEAATEGYKVMGKGEAQKGLNGILNYIRTVGTPFEKTLAQAIKLAVAGKAPINIKFVKEGTSQYDPKTNTITINETSSKEVALHEALHGALQWFVYTNPNAAQVVALKTALQRVVNYDGKLPPKAADVQALLKKILAGKSKTAELDAVLELVSYGNTLNDFRRALQAMESNAPRTFTKFANDVMDAIYALVRRMLGSNQTVASDVMENTFQLLEAARAATQETAPTKGNVLMAEVTSYGKTPVEAGTALPSKEADAINQQFQNPLTDAQYKALSTTLLPEQISSKFIFDMFGWAKVPGMAESTARKISDYIQKNHTGAAKVASWVNSHFGLQSGVREALIRAKDDKRGGSMIYNQIAQYFTNLPPQESVAVLEYMDAKLANLRKQGPAPVFPSNDAQMKDLADATITKWWEYARALRDPKQRDAYAGIEQPGGRWTGGVKFSQGLAFAENVDQLASPTFGVRNISQLISSRTKNEVTADAITFRTDANGDAILDDKFVGMYLLTPTLKKRLDNTKTTAEASQILAELMPDEFISAAKLTTDGKPMVNAAGVQLIPDRNYLWDLQEKEKGGFKLTARLDAKQALLVKKGRDLGHALQNTMAILANSYSANRLTEALAEYEAKTPNAVAFNSLDDLNAMLNGEYKGDKFVPNTEAASWTTRVKQNQVVKLSDSEAKAETVKGLYRNRNQWVQLPNGPTYGALAGKIVNGSVWSAIEDMSDRRPLVNSAVYNGTMRWFKKAKTVYNPATWATNVASNFTMAMMDDIPLPTIGYATKLYVGYMLPPAMASKLGISLTREQQQLMLEIMKTNALLGDFSSTELKQSIYDSMRSTIGDTEQGVAERIMQFAKMEKDRIEAIKKYAGKGADAAERANQLLGDWYSMQDNIFRVASMLNNLGQQSQAGKPIDAEAYRRAGDHARFAFLDYDIDSKAVRIMRQTAFPFISWPYAAAKMIGNVAVHKPWKLVNLYAGLWILDGLTQAITGDDDDELRTSGPEWARNRMLFGLGPHTHIRVPFMGDSENPVYYDLGKYITPSSFGDRVPNAFLGLSWWPSFITPGGPYISSAIALLGGIDPYNGKPLSPPTDSDWEKLSDRLVYGQSLFAPNLPFLNARELAKAQEAFTATEGRSENYSSLYMARTAGLRLYDFNVQGALDQQDRAAKAIEREYKTEIGKLKRKMERLETPDWDAFYEREAELVKRMEKRIAEVRGDTTEEE
jgi:hypothetical protein